MNEPTITCPNCGNEFPLDAAFREHFAKEKRQAVADAVQSARQSAIEETENRLRQEMAQQSADLKNAREDLAKERESHQAELESVHSEIESAVTERFQQQMTQQGKDLKQAQDELATERQSRDEAVKSAREETEARVEERLRLESEAHKTEKGRLLREVESLRRQLRQGSIELQGEALEVWLKESLQAAFPLDRIEDVAKGQRGADLIQRVVNPRGQSCGVILWEAKNWKNWNDSWLAKIDEDAMRVGAELKVIVSETLPEGIKTFDRINGVWVSSVGSAPALGLVLRHLLLQAHNHRSALIGREGKMEAVYSYLAGEKFHDLVQRMVLTYETMKKQVDREETAMRRHWAQRRKELDIVRDLTIDMYTDISSIIGADELPQVDGLTLDALTSGEDS